MNHIKKLEAARDAAEGRRRVTEEQVTDLPELVEVPLWVGA